MRWVEEELPFGYDKARRLMAIHLAYTQLPKHVQEQLPRPWQALYAVTRLGRDELIEAVESGTISPKTTIAQAKQITRVYRGNKRSAVKPRYSQADLIAGSLMDHHPENLDPLVFEALVNWCSLREEENFQTLVG